jgi:iron complex transport system substrate-binding protein
VREALASGTGLYHLDEELLASLKPDVVLTQDLCSVCSVDVGLVRKAIARLNPPPVVVNLNPNSLQDVLTSIVQVLTDHFLIDPWGY